MDMFNAPFNAGSMNPYEEDTDPFAQPDPMEAKLKQALLQRIAAAQMQDNENLAGTQATLRATQRMPSGAYGNFGSEQPPIDRSLVADAMRRKQMEDSMTLNPGMSRFLDNPMPEEDASSRPSIEDNLARLKGGEYGEGRRSYSAPDGAQHHYSGIQVSHDDKGGIGLKGVMTDEDRASGRQLYSDTVAERQFKAGEDKKAQRERIAAFQKAKQDQLDAPIGGLLSERQFSQVMQHPQGPAIIAAMYNKQHQNDTGPNGEMAMKMQQWMTEREDMQKQRRIAALRERAMNEPDPARKQQFLDEADLLEGIPAPTPKPVIPPPVSPFAGSGDSGWMSGMPTY